MIVLVDGPHNQASVVPEGSNQCQNGVDFCTGGAFLDTVMHELSLSLDVLVVKYLSTFSLMLLRYVLQVMCIIHHVTQ